MTAPSGQALAMKVALARCAERHGTLPPESCELPLSDPCPGPLCIRGVAAATSIDSQRTAFSPKCFGFKFDLKTIPVLYRHDSSRVIGTLDEVSYGPRGELIAQATIDDPEAARCPAFSVGATILRYELVDEHLPTAYARVLEARLEEVSITRSPANADAIILEKWPAAPGRFFILMQRRVELIAAMAAMLAPPPERRPA
jgi:hypothetical protein